MQTNIEARDELRALASNIRIARKRRKRTLADMAERTGVSISTLSRLESGDKTISIGTVLQVLSALDLLRGLANLTAPEHDVAQVLKEVRDMRARRISVGRRSFREEDLNF